MNYQQFLLNLRKGEIFPLYLFSGPEEYLKKEALKKLRDILIPPEALDFNYHVFYGKEDSGVKISETASTLPFMYEKRLVIVRDAEKLSSSDSEAILNYASSPSSFTCLVIVVGKVDRRKKLYSLFTKSGREVSFKQARPGDILGWIRTRVREEGKRITSEAAFEIRERAGGDLGILSGHLAKLFLYVGDSPNIGVKEVRLLIGEGRETSSFELVEAISERKKAQALKILGRILAEGRKAPEIIGLIAWQMRRVAAAKSRIIQGENPGKVAQSLGVFPFFQKKFLSQVKQFSLEKLSENFCLLLKADKQFKLGKLTPDLALELLLVNLCA